MSSTEHNARVGPRLPCVHASRRPKERPVAAMAKDSHGASRSERREDERRAMLQAIHTEMTQVSVIDERDHFGVDLWFHDRTVTLRLRMATASRKGHLCLDQDDDAFRDHRPDVGNAARSFASLSMTSRTVGLSCGRPISPFRCTPRCAVAAEAGDTVTPAMPVPPARAQSPRAAAHPATRHARRRSRAGASPALRWLARAQRS